VYTLNDLEQPLLPATDARPLDKARVSLVSGLYFDVLGVAMTAGRPITPMEDRAPGASPVAVISHAFWTRHFGQARDIVSRALEPTSWACAWHSAPRGAGWPAGLVLRDCAIVTALALAAGVPLALAAVSPLSSQLYGVEPNDPTTVLLVAGLLATVAALAAARPAHTAARVDPLALHRAD
jgi:hypothetical protein